MPTPVTLNLVPKSFGDGYFWIAAFKGDEETGPFGLGDNPTEAMKDLIDRASGDTMKTFVIRHQCPSPRWA
jgi:hypothetical protein